MEQKRIWELDALRGLSILIMVVLHFICNLTDFYGILVLEDPRVFDFVLYWGGKIFLLLSGICVTLGSHPVRRGLIVLVCGLLFSAVTAGMYLLNFADRSLIIYFGVLHCLGCCMLLWPLLRKLPNWPMAVLGVLIVTVGLYFNECVSVTFPWLIPFGLFPSNLSTSDYFPLLPNLGFFLIGAVIGRTLYARKTTLFPRVNARNILIRFLTACGRHSLWIYLLHQPVLTGLIGLYLTFS